MSWPIGRAPTWNVGRLGDDEPCPRGHVGNFLRTRSQRRKCRTCASQRMKQERNRRILRELEQEARNA